MSTVDIAGIGLHPFGRFEGTSVTEMGGVIFPPLPAFYHRPGSIDEMVDQTVERVIDMFALGSPIAAAWPGLKDSDD